MFRAIALLICTWAATSFAQSLPVEPVNWRYDEDWSVLRDHPVGHAPRWLPAKYQSLDDAGSIWISSGLEARVRYEGFRNNLWRRDGVPDEYLWLRLLPHADLHAGAIRVFAQGIASRVSGLRSEPAPVDATGNDLLQGFAEARFRVSGGSLSLRAGRSLVALGTERLVGLRYGPNVPQAFDGVLAIGTLRGVEVEALRLHPVRVGAGDFDDRADEGRRLSGLYATFPLRHSRSKLDAYVLDYERESRTFGDIEARERRRTFGLRSFGRASPWSWNWEAMVQRGRFGADRISAWSMATETSYTWANARNRPVVRLRANIVSGDRTPADHRLGTFDPMFPKGKYFGELSPIGPYNIFNLHPDVELTFAPALTLGIAAAAYWRTSPNDGIYDVPGERLRSGPGTSARFVGMQTEGILSWNLDLALSVSASWSVFKPGRFIRATGPAETIHMLGLETRYRF